MRVYRVKKNNDGSLYMKSGKVIESGETLFIVEDKDSQVGAIQMKKSVACFTEEEAISAYQDDIISRLDQHRKAVEAIGKETEVLNQFIRQLAVEKAVDTFVNSH